MKLVADCCCIWLELIVQVLRQHFLWNNTTQLTYNTQLIWPFSSVWFGGFMFDPRVPQRRLCDKRCLDVDLKASQELLRREPLPPALPDTAACDPLASELRVTLNWSHMSPLSLLFTVSEVETNKTKSSWEPVVGFSRTQDGEVFRHADALYPFINSQWFSAVLLFWRDMINVRSSAAETADSRTYGVAVASNDSIYF